MADEKSLTTITKQQSLPIQSRREIAKRTVQESDSLLSSPVTILQIATAADEAPLWWSPRRDQYLDRFWPTEPYLAGAIYSIMARNASFRYEFTGPLNEVRWSQDLLAQANFGSGWQDFITKITQDLLTQGNGACFEIIRPARARVKNGDYYDAIKVMDDDTGEMGWMPFDSTTGKFIHQDFKLIDSPIDLPIGIAHLDAQRIDRTGDLDFPILYTDLKGKRHKMAYWQVCTLEDMPSPREELHNIQHCAIDRSLRLSQIIRDMLIYKHEKVSGRFARAIHITNVDAIMLEDAIAQAQASNDSKGLMRYSQPIVLATVNPDSIPSVATIPLATLPDGFSEEESMKWYIAGLANAFGVDYGFLAPLPGNKLGTSTQAETQERQAKGKSSSLFQQMLTYKFSYNGILPRCVQFKFGIPDPFEESEKDRALARRARAYSTLIQSNLLPPIVVRQIAADRGDIDPKYLEMMGEADLTPVVTLSGSERPCLVKFTPQLTPRQLQLFQPQPEQPNGDA